MNGTIVDRLIGKQRVSLDSTTFIYFIERHPIYHSLVRPLFERLDDGRLWGIASYITLLEVLVLPLKKQQTELVREYAEILVHSRSLALYPVNRTVAERGAEIRAQYGFRTPDAIQLATALQQRADIFVTNDNQFHRFDQLEVVVLNDFIGEVT